MIFSYHWLQEYIKGKLPGPEKLAELLALHSFEVKEVKKIGKDWVLDIDVLPNRAADCFSHLGIARECSAILNLKFNPPLFPSPKTDKAGVKDFVSVEVKDKKACPRYTAKVVTGIRVGPSPQWLKDRLRVCGLRPINNIVDLANYVMLETGQPLHAFDGEKLEGKRILVRLAKKGEKITTLDGEKYGLDSDILVIADAKNPVALAGIKGGKIPEVGKSTKTVVLESANFDRLNIYRTSKKIGLQTDASLRFASGLDPNLASEAIERAAALIQKIAGGKIAKGIIDIYPKKALAKRIKLDLGYLQGLLGVKVLAKEIKSILKRLGFQYKELEGRYLMIKVPTWRLDILLPEDLIEEIGRIYGYERIPAVFPRITLVPPKRNEEIFWEDLTKNILKEVGLSEVYNYSFISEKDARAFNQKKIGLVKVENPISIEQKYLRPSLVPNLLKNVQRNQKYFEEIKIFELGKIFFEKEGLIEKKILAGLLAGAGRNFYQTKGIVDLLLRKLGISDVWYDSYRAGPREDFLWHPQKSAEIKVGGQEIGFLGEISSAISNFFEIKNGVVAFELDFERLSEICSEEHEYQPLSRYPSAVRDLAVLVPQGTKVIELLNKINVAGGRLVRDIDLFDIYEGRELPGGKKSFAFHLVYQAEDRTLTSQEIDKIHQKIIKALEENPEWQVRR